MKKISQLGAASLAFLISVVLFVITLGITGIIVQFMDNGDVIYLSLTFATILPLGLGFLAYMLISKQPFKKFWGGKVSIEQLTLSAFLAPCTYLVVILIQSLWIALLSLIGIPPMPDGLPDINTGLTFTLAILAVAITPAFFEEIIFRGVLQGSFATKKRSGIAITITAALFMLMHGAVESLPYTFILGLIMGYLCYRSGSLWPPIIFHFSNNALAVFGKFIATRGDLATQDMETLLGSSGMLDWIPLVVLALIGGGMSFLVLSIFDKVSPAIRVSSQTDRRPLQVVEWLPLLIGALILLGMIGATTVTAILMPMING